MPDRQHRVGSRFPVTTCGECRRRNRPDIRAPAHLADRRTPTNPLIFVLPVATTLLILAAAIWTLRRLSARHAAARAAFMASAPVGGTMDVPVRWTYSRGGGLMGGKAKNNFGPELSIAGDGIHHRVLRRGVLPYGDIEHVDLRKTLLGMVLIFKSGGGRHILAADVGDLAVAQRVLAALPRQIPLTNDAAIARDGNSAAATPGLRPYSGPLS